MTSEITFKHIPDYIWTPVRTKPRCEKKAAEFCRGNNIHCYLPLLKKLHRYKRKTVEFHVPMFPGYVFCNLDNEYYKLLVQSNSIVYRINMDPETEEQLLIELKSIRLYEKISQEKDVLIKPELATGSKIKVRNGPLEGLEGYVEKRKGKTLVAINIEILGQSVSTEVDAGDLELDKYA